MTIKILIFPTINSLDYWFKYVKRYLVDECKVQAKTYKGKREIIVDNICLKFMTSSESIRRYRGLRDFETHYNLESKFENNFERTLYELLEVNNKETAGNLYIKSSYETLQDKIERLNKENYEKDTKINKLNNVIDRMAEEYSLEVNTDILDICACCTYNTEDCHGDYCKEALIKYFTNKVEEDK